MLRDRGTIKWTALMLPEHVEMLKRLWQEDKRIPKPLLDSQELEMINRQLIDAYRLQKMVSISVYQDGLVTGAEGLIVKVDQYANRITLEGEGKMRQSIACSSILAITCD